MTFKIFKLGHGLNSSGQIVFCLSLTPKKSPKPEEILQKAFSFFKQ